MAISLRNRKAEALARELAELQHISMTQAIIEALELQKARLEKEHGSTAGSEKARLLKVMEIGCRCASLPDQDRRSADEILGYDETGLPQ